MYCCATRCRSLSRSSGQSCIPNSASRSFSTRWPLPFAQPSWGRFPDARSWSVRRVLLRNSVAWPLPSACSLSRNRSGVRIPPGYRTASLLVSYAIRFLSKPLFAVKSLLWRPRAQSSARRFLHKRADLCLRGRSQLLQREGDRPQPAFVETRRVAEAERRVPALELLRVLEEADDLAVLVVRGHPVPEFRREGRRAGFDDRVDPLGHGAIRVRHFGDLREHGACVLLLRRGRLPLFDELLHRGSFLVREYAALLVGRGGALGGLLRGLRRAHGK